MANITSLPTNVATPTTTTSGDGEKLRRAGGDGEKQIYARGCGIRGTINAAATSRSLRWRPRRSAGDVIIIIITSGACYHYYGEYNARAMMTVVGLFCTNTTRGCVCCCCRSPCVCVWVCNTRTYMNNNII